MGRDEDLADLIERMTRRLDAQDQTIAQQGETIASQSELIARQSALIEKQAGRIDDLESRLKKDSRTFSKPPSSDGPWSKRRGRRRPPSDKKQGAQPGHPGASRELVDPGDVDEIVDHEPDACSCGHGDLVDTGISPRRHQVTEIPPLVATVTEHRLHGRLCSGCGARVFAELPAGVWRTAFGPRLQALVVTLVAPYRLSRAETARLLGEVFDVKISVGSVSNIERRMSRAREPAFEQALEALRRSGLAHIDETPWKRRGVLHWLWTGVGDEVTVHRIDRRRNREALERLIGADFGGLMVTDRLASYDRVPAKRRQLCWAHLERDFRAFAVGARSGRAFGEAGLVIAQALMRSVREHKRNGDRERFENELRPHLGSLIELLVEAACSDTPGVSGFAAHLLARADSLWLFADEPGVPPTNNTAERSIRKAVLWRTARLCTPRARPTSGSSVRRPSPPSMTSYQVCVRGDMRPSLPWSLPGPRAV